MKMRKQKAQKVCHKKKTDLEITKAVQKQLKLKMK